MKTISRSFLLRMKNVSEKRCRENQNTHFILNNFFFSKILHFTTMWGKVVELGRHHDNMAHEHCMLNT